MCNWGDTVQYEINGKVRHIDRCIFPLVKALNEAGQTTIACCCGHGKHHGNIILADGRFLNIHADREVWEKAEKLLETKKS